MEAALISNFILHVPEPQAVITFQVYMELCELKRYYNVSYEFNSSVNKIILLANKSKHCPISAFVPVIAHEELTFSKIRQIALLKSFPTVYIVIVHPDSTCIYYQVKDGLMEPTEVSAKHLREDKQKKLDADLKKHSDLIQHAALIGVAITLPKNDTEKL